MRVATPQRKNSDEELNNFIKIPKRRRINQGRFPIDRTNSIDLETSLPEDLISLLSPGEPDRMVLCSKMASEKQTLNINYQDKRFIVLSKGKSEGGPK